MKTANNLRLRCGSAFTSHVTYTPYFKFYRCKWNSKGESSALVSTLTLSPPEVPDLAFTPVSHLLLKAMGTSSHLPHYGVNVYTDRHSQPRLRDYSQGKYSPYKTHTRNSATPWGLNSKSNLRYDRRGTHTLATVCASTWSAQANTCRREHGDMQMKRLFLYLLFWLWALRLSFR